MKRIRQVKRNEHRMDFESSRKRYTTQHNGKMCERVADALEALYRVKKQENTAQGKWISSVGKYDFYVEKCSECGYIEEWNLETDRNFCPHCGAKMNKI